MTLQEYIESLPKEKQYRAAIKLAKLALPIWDNYAGNKRLTYRDSIVCIKHTVNTNLLKNTIESIEQKLDKTVFESDENIKNLYNQYLDPLTALQDNDWHLPDKVLKVFYAVYNLIESFTENEKTIFGDSTIYVSISFSIEALEISKILTSNELNKLVSSFKSQI